MEKTYTIIVPMYNVQAYISECIESVKAQTYPKWELIIVDDESEDASLCIARKYEKDDVRIKVITKRHGGPSQARNLGLKEASGDFIVLLDGDDYLAVDHLEKCNDILDDSCDMCIFNNHVNFTQEIEHRVILFPTFEGVNELSKNEKLNIIFSLENRLPAAAVLTIYRRNFLDENNIEYNEKYHCSEDLDFFLNNIILAKKIVFADHQFYFYRQDNNESITRNISALSLLNRMDVYEKWHKKYSTDAIDGFDNTIVVKLLKRDMRSSVLLYHCINKNDDKKSVLKEKIYETKYIWGSNKILESYWYNMIVMAIVYRARKFLSKIKRDLDLFRN